MMKALVSSIVAIVVIVVYVGFLGAANQTAIGTQTMAILNVIPVFIGLAALGVIIAIVVQAFKSSGSGGGI